MVAEDVETKLKRKKRNTGTLRSIAKVCKSINHYSVKICLINIESNSVMRSAI